jgi:maltose alpha-D-glucosyltransferase/alpha-amylase
VLDDLERRIAFAFLFTMPGAPFLYYGDEIGMPYRWTKTVEGAYNRAGSRTPMQWNSGKNMGFSEAEAEKLYYPVDTAPNAVNVEAQDNDPASFLNHMRGVIALRHGHADLQNYSPFTVYSAVPGSRMFAYKRGSYLLAVNPGLTAEELKLDGKYEVVYTIGDPVVEEGKVTMNGQSFIVLKPAE